MKILGIHYESHDTGATIINNTEVLAAVNEERLSRIKEDGSFPEKSIAEVIKIAKITYSELDAIAISGEIKLITSLIQHANYKLKPFLYSILYLLKTRQFSMMLSLLRTENGFNQMRLAWGKKQKLKLFLRRARQDGFKGRIIYVAHDEAHAASAYYTSGFSECLIPVFEGYSYTNASSIWLAKDHKLQRVKNIKWPHSPGQFYRCVTQVLGFSPRRHAGKITGLAAYGKYQTALPLVEPLMTYNKGLLKVNPLLYVLQYKYQTTGKIPEYFSGITREDLSATFQHVLEQTLTTLVAEEAQRHNQSNIALAGGVAANVKLNQRIAELDVTKKLHVHPAMSDAGQALGAAYGALLYLGDKTKPEKIKNAYFGTNIKDTEVKKLLERKNIKYTIPNDLADEVASLLSEKKVVAICTGKMEYGPRALGNRTIMYSPTDKSVNDWLNKQLNRTEFMPFAPVTLVEYAKDCYDNKLLDKAEHAANFMTISINCSEQMKQTQPAVVHVDGTARPQLIERSENNIYYDILKSFHKKTGIPSLVNTSFNMHEEPIVRTAEDAIRSFQLSNIDYLLLGTYLISK